MIRFTIVCLASTLTALPLPAQSRIVTSATTPAETVSWSSGVSYTYDGSGNMRQIGKDRFAYDKVGRLAQAEVNGVTRLYTYDAFGNRTGCTHAPGTTELSDCQFGQSVDSSTNRVKNLNYDDGGNLRAYQGHTYTYDVLNMPVRDDSGSGFAREFIYTADDERIATHAVGSSWSWTIRRLDGKVLREFTSTAQGVFTWARDYVYRDGLLLASVRPSGLGAVREHYHLDHLGTPRRVTNQNNRTVGFHDYYAFGPEVSGGLTEPAATPLQYTGHERDKWLTDGPDTLDYMHARYYSPAQGRFFSVDPVITKAAMGNPQYWNRYAYVGNSPMKFVDPDGRTLKLSACADDSKNSGCQAQYNQYLSTFGNQASDAARFLSIGKGGVVTFNGISGSAFAARFGMMGRATNYLISNRVATFSLVTGASSRTARAGGAFFDQNEFRGQPAPGGTIGIDTAAFPISRGLVSISATEALAHEIGHAVGSLIPGVRDAIDERLGGAATRTPFTMNEGYSMAWENRWRVEVLGLSPNDIRYYYNQPNDVLHNSKVPLFP